MKTNTFLLHTLLKTFDFKELIQEWRNHQFSYKAEAPKSPKSKHANWAKQQYETISKIEAPSSKFMSQLHKIFHVEKLDAPFLQERCEAAYDYFFKTLDQVAEELLLKIEEIKRTKKVKAFYDELMVLEEMQIKAILQLKKARLLTQIITEGKEISKKNLAHNYANNLFYS